MRWWYDKPSSSVSGHVSGMSNMNDQKTCKRFQHRQPNVCWCGCGGATKSRFVPGHDARFHSLAKRVARGLAAMPESFVSEDARADFLKHHDAERIRIAAKAPVKFKNSATQAADGSVAADRGDKPHQHEPTAQIESRPALNRTFPNEPTLCIGLDFAWWGGGRVKSSQKDTLAYAMVNDEQAGAVQLKRVVSRPQSLPKRKGLPILPRNRPQDRWPRLTKACSTATYIVLPKKCSKKWANSPDGISISHVRGSF